jgi:hypothetical protein
VAAARFEKRQKQWRRSAPLCGGARTLRRCGWWFGCLVAFLIAGLPARAAELPPWLPHYDLDIRLEVEQHQVLVRERVTWTNPHKRPTHKIVFNAHAHYIVPDREVARFAKMLEILRLAPNEVLDFGGPPLQVEAATLLGQHAAGPPVAPSGLPFAYQPNNDTALEVMLPVKVGSGQSVTVELAFTLRLPQKQGRWGQWKGVTFLAQWLPVAAFYDDNGWQPTPFIPWHQPFFNEAGIYTAHITLPTGQTLGSTGQVVGQRDLGKGWQQVEVQGGPARDFALFASALYQEQLGQAGPVRVRCLALPGHEYYARQMVRTVEEALPVYEQWFGPFPYSQFTLVESYFGWNGNECGDLVMIDSRIFGMPHLAGAYVDMLVSHELSHQWWYNAVGTNGYAETWMDEGLAVHFSHRLMDRKHGNNNELLAYPRGLEWLPNIHRQDYRYSSLLGVVARGQDGPTVQDMPKFSHLVNLSAMAYDRGGKVVGMIEDRLGSESFLDFMRQVYAKYYFRILRVADYQHELEAYTGRSWEEFFKKWLYGKGMTDWCLEGVELDEGAGLQVQGTGLLAPPRFLGCLRRRKPCRAVVYLRQKGECLEPTVLGFCMDGSTAYQVRIPIRPDLPSLEVEQPPAHVEALGRGRFRVEVRLPCRPTQITVDPDEVLLDRDPSNNSWIPQVRVRVTPVYFELDETDLTNAFDRLNVILGPWVFGSTYADPWYTRSDMVGFRAGVYRTQEFFGGAYLAYRTDDQNIVAGLDGVWQHFPWPNTQVGFNVEKSLVTLSAEDVPVSRAVVYGRYIFNYSSSLYLPPIDYVEAFGVVQNRSLPTPAATMPGANPFNDQSALGLHYHLDYRTPYWDPIGGFAVDATVQQGFAVFGDNQPFQTISVQASTVKTMPDWLNWLRNVPALQWVPDTRLAGRVWGAAALPNNAQIFTLGGADYFRGFDLSERQGSLVWLASLEWRVPLVRDVNWDCCDHVAGVRNVFGAIFYDVGDAYLSGHSFGPVAHAFGAGLRLDVAWFSMIERTVLRFDVAKTVNSSAPVQFWFGVCQPF